MATYWKPDILSENVSHLQEGNLHLFAGAGLSKLAGFPLWEDLLERFANAYCDLPNAKPKIKEAMPFLVNRRRLDVIDHLIEAGKKEYVGILKDVFNRKGVFDNTHKYLLELPFAGYITINYDRCFEDCCRQYNLKPSLLNSGWFCYPLNQFIRNPHPISNLRTQNPYILHMHGCIMAEDRIDLDNIILTNEQYRQFYNNDDMNEIYDNWVYENTLFLGTSLSDPYFKMVFDRKRYSTNVTALANRKDSYVVCPLPEDEDELKCSVSDTELLGIKYIYFTDMENGLRNIIKELWEAFEDSKASVVQDKDKESKE